jgi:hypothetical protein
VADIASPDIASPWRWSAGRQPKRRRRLYHHHTGTITKFTTVNKRGNIGGKKRLRGSDSDKTIISQWTRTGRYFDKIDENGKPYRVDVLACKARGCRIKRQHKVNADGSLNTNTGNLAKHYRLDHAKIHALSSMKTVVLTAPDGKVERAIEMSFAQQLRHHIDLAFAVCVRTLRYFARETGLQWRTSCRTFPLGTACLMNAR